MKKGFFYFVFLLVFKLSAQEVYQRSFSKMGSGFELTLIAEDAQSGEQFLAEGIAEIERIERLISSWDPASETSQVNRMAGEAPVKVSDELFELVQRAKAISRLTDGAFDVTYASVDPIWFFRGETITPPDSSEIAASVAKIGFQKCC